MRRLLLLVALLLVATPVGGQVDPIRSDSATNEDAGGIGVVLTPSRVLIRIGKTAPRKIMPTLDNMPMPSQMITNGSSATRGVAFMAFTNGSKT